MEPLGLTVKAPAELATLFGADPKHPVKWLRITKAFYGLVQAPRCWFNDVANTMLSHGWKGIMGDRCIFLWYDEEDDNNVIGAAGIHVDDFLLCGNEQHPKYAQAEKALMSKYKWGKWQTDEFDFAGCHIAQAKDGSVRSTRRAMLKSGSMRYPSAVNEGSFSTSWSSRDPCLEVIPDRSSVPSGHIAPPERSGNIHGQHHPQDQQADPGGQERISSKPAVSRMGPQLERSGDSLLV